MLSTDLLTIKAEVKTFFIKTIFETLFSHW